jgi:hypothetical protein
MLPGFRCLSIVIISHQFLICRFCVCYKHKCFEKMIEAMFLDIRLLHSDVCPCDCASCQSRCCTTVHDNISSFMRHSLCPAAPLLSGSDINFYKWECLALTCNDCWVSNPNHLFGCPTSQWQSPTCEFILF